MSFCNRSKYSHEGSNYYIFIFYILYIIYSSNPWENNHRGGTTGHNNIFSYSITYCIIDIDECINGDHGCNQNCTNTDGSYKCICEDGYVLDNDMKTCIGMCIII